MYAQIFLADASLAGNISWNSIQKTRQSSVGGEKRPLTT